LNKNGDWGLGIGDWAQSPIPNPQSPIPNPQSPIPNLCILLLIFNNIKFYIFLNYSKNKNKKQNIIN
jgi:hypothetical protein